MARRTLEELSLQLDGVASTITLFDLITEPKEFNCDYASKKVLSAISVGLTISLDAMQEELDEWQLDYNQLELKCERLEKELKDYKSGRAQAANAIVNADKKGIPKKHMLKASELDLFKNMIACGEEKEAIVEAFTYGFNAGINAAKDIAS